MKYVRLGFSPMKKWQFKSANSAKLFVEAAHDLLMSNFFQTIHNFIFFFYLNSTK